MEGVDIYNPVTGDKVRLIRMTQRTRIKNQLNPWEKSAKSNNP